MNLLTFLNMHLNELQNAVIQNLATDGTTGKIIKEVTDTEGNPVTLAPIQAKFDLFTIDFTGDVVVDGDSQVIGNGDTTKLKLVNSGVTAGTYGENTGVTTISNGGTIIIPKITIDSKGRTTSAEDQELVIDTGATTRFEHSNPILTPVSGVCTWTITHNLDCIYPIVSVYEVSTKELVMVDVKSTDGNTTVITILSDSTISAETYHATIIA